MFTNGSKLLVGNALVAAVAAAVYYGGTDDRMGTMLLLGAAVCALGLAVPLLGRVVPATATAVVAQPTYDTPPARNTAWPAAAGLAAVLFLVGLAVNLPLMVLGLVTLALAAASWFVEVWSDSSPRARAAALEAQQRVIGPAGVPVLALLAIGVVVFSLSRVLIAVNTDAAWIIAVAVAALILVMSFVVAARPQLSANTRIALIGLLLLAFVVAGVVAAAVGPRTEERVGAGLAQETAKGIAFTEKTLTLPTGGRAAIEFDNLDKGVQHNIAIYKTKAFQQVIFRGTVITGQSKTTYVFDAPPAGTYAFRCDVHPTQMQGTVTVSNQAGGE